MYGEKSKIDNYKNDSKSAIDRLIFVAAIATPVMTLPQVYQIWVEHSREASIVTWSSYTVIACIWLWYGYKYKDQAIIITQSLSIITYLLIVIGLAR